MKVAIHNPITPPTPTEREVVGWNWSLDGNDKAVQAIIHYVEDRGGLKVRLSAQSFSRAPEFWALYLERPDKAATRWLEPAEVHHEVQSAAQGNVPVGANRVQNVGGGNGTA